MYNSIQKFELELHKKYLISVTNDVIHNYDSSKAQLSSVFIHGIYWVLCCSDLIQCNIFDQLHSAKNKFLHLLRKCERELFIDNFRLKFYSINPFDFIKPSILSILSGIQINTILNNKIVEDKKNELNVFIKSLVVLKNEKIYINNSKNYLSQFDVRFIYSTLLVYYLSNNSDLKQPDPAFQISELTRILVRMQNKDGGFGKRYKDESHAGYTFCAVSSIAIIKKITKNDSIDLLFNFNRLTNWLLKRIVVSENHETNKSRSYCFNGRIGKKCDVCYSWWVTASLKIVGTTINKNMDCSLFLNLEILKTLINGILCHQNIIYGGFQKSPFNIDRKNRPDPLHTFLSISALSLLFNSVPSQLNSEFYGKTKPSEIFWLITKIDPISVLPEKNGFIWKVIKVDELEWLDINSETLSYNCSCGDVFWTTLPYLEKIADSEDKGNDTSVILQCESCSLKIKVVFNRESLNKIRKTIIN
ncbi:RAB geranylgeranyl transferase [Cryptosporidium sp. chipmunk genotype I]|uniref:RAB geranylgeranyl transferase n=1 Tax=Cryptosporidium sp. chipmunk genotype I TaxID=1280935 RepID=UPI00351A9864|nr:RAB geranylgeranyl transferase [Cryptosporidium sp. chipmunk genotype I]